MSVKIKFRKSAFLTLIFLSSIFLFSFVFAAHVITLVGGGTTASVLEDVSNLYNISVNNSDAGQVANITQVNVTLPSSFTFNSGDEGTSSAAALFENSTNGSTVLSWSNFSEYVVNGTDIVYFWFNATGATPGNYNFSVATVNASGVSYSNISVTVNDTTAPNATYAAPSESDSANLSRGNIQVNVSATDNSGSIETIVIRLFNETQDAINTSYLSGVDSYFLNFTSLSNGTYYFNATVNDTTGNAFDAETRTVLIDTVAPNVTALIAPANGTSSSTTSFTFQFNVTDSNPIEYCSLIFDGSGVANSTGSINNTGGTNGISHSGISVGEHNWTVSCTDYSSNTGTSNELFFLTITAPTNSSGGSSGGGGGGSGIVYSVYLSEGKPIVREGLENRAYSFSIGGSKHSAHIDSINLGSQHVVVTVSSEPQTQTIAVGSSGKFDVDDNPDNYDLEVGVSSVKTSNNGVPIAQLSFTLINEKKPSSAQAPAIEQKEDVRQAPPETEPAPEQQPLAAEEGSSLLGIIFGIIGLVVLVVAAVIGITAQQKKKKKSRRH